MLGRGRITKKQLDNAIGDKLNPSIVLCTGAWRAFKTYSKDKGFIHYRFKTGVERTKGIFHIQNVNNFYQRLKQWILRFKGIATKYLQHYLSWIYTLDTLTFDIDERSIRTFAVESCLHPIKETNATTLLRKIIV
ncbi:IS1595 family transposase [Viridibacillus sp. YIM B01967]|uniref:IS1595 family transposase n=1 Tax=Viridibacillus soli TaxID=2798301 RepID=A0ABS1HCW3_9BACL|nr:IS1595 family transposase [Viridibacillus soli]